MLFPKFEYFKRILNRREMTNAYFSWQFEIDGWPLPEACTKKRDFVKYMYIYPMDKDEGVKSLSFFEDCSVQLKDSNREVISFVLQPFPKRRSTVLDGPWFVGLWR